MGVGDGWSRETQRPHPSPGVLGGGGGGPGVMGVLGGGGFRGDGGGGRWSREA